jgi:hypothetical protein
MVLRCETPFTSPPAPSLPAGTLPDPSVLGPRWANGKSPDHVPSNQTSLRPSTVEFRRSRQVVSFVKVRRRAGSHYFRLPSEKSSVVAGSRYEPPYGDRRSGRGVQRDVRKGTIWQVRAECAPRADTAAASAPSHLSGIRRSAAALAHLRRRRSRSRTPAPRLSGSASTPNSWRSPPHRLAGTGSPRRSSVAHSPITSVAAVSQAVPRRPFGQAPCGRSSASGFVTADTRGLLPADARSGDSGLGRKTGPLHGISSGRRIPSQPTPPPGDGH